MPEPTLLDYVKQRLRFWQKRSLRLRDYSWNDPAETLGETSSPLPAEQNQAATSTDKPARVSKPLPWRMVLSVSLAFTAQSLLEPPVTQKTAALILYLAAIGLAVWSAVREGWLTRTDETETGNPDARVFKAIRWQLILPAFLLAAAAYFTFSTYLFDFVNTSLWVGSILLFALAVIDLEPFTRFFSSFRQTIKNGFIGFKLTPWILIGAIAAGVVIYLRAAHLVTVPPEMTSDHAEKLQDVQDVLNGQWHVFFTRNTGREAFQFYWTALMIKVFGTGISFLSLKIGTVLAGLLTLPYIYLLGKEFASKRVGFLAAFMAGIAYWPNVISRVALRFTLYPFFAAPALFYLMRGLKRGNRNDFIWAGLFIGLGLQGYSPYRVVPILAILVCILFFLHKRTRQAAETAFTGLTISGLLATIVTIPLLRYAVDNPDAFFYRLSTRVGELERPLPGNPWLIFFDNLKNSLLMFGVSDGSAWLHSIPFRPALDVISAALLYLGFALLIYRYLRQRRWEDLIWLISIPVLMLPSILSLAFPQENPALNRSAGALIPVFLIVGMVMDGIYLLIKRSLTGRKAGILSGGVILLMLVLSTRQNYRLVFKDYQDSYRAAAGNTTEMGQVIRGFINSVGSADSAWVVGYPYWVDTRLVSIEAGVPIRDYAIWPEHFSDSLNAQAPLLFILNMQDEADLAELQSMYPKAITSVYTSQTAGRDFRILFVPEK
jgi:hypothetical protein